LLAQLAQLRLRCVTLSEGLAAGPWIGGPAGPV